MRRSLLLTRLVLAALALAAAPATAQYLSPPKTLPGDAVTGTAAGRQSTPAIAAGGPGYLVAWEEQRTNLSNFSGAGGSPGLGNLIDIYAARYDESGNLLDTTPILVATAGMSQETPQVAWNGSSWLVVFVTQRPDWYFFEDIVGVRVAADGTVLDADPIMIRPESTLVSNDYGENPCVTSDGNNWMVAWESIDFTDNKAMLQGTRVAPDGTVLDPNYRTLYKFTSLVFGPEFPEAAYLGGEYLLVWNDFGPVRTRRFDAALNPLGPVQTVPGLLGRTQVAASPGGYLLVATLEALRLSPSGVPLDASPIQIPKAAPIFAQSATVDRSDVAWSGSEWAVTYDIPISGSIFDDADIFLIRIDTAGTVLDPVPQNIDPSPAGDRDPVLAGSNGGLLVSYTSDPTPNQDWDDIRSTFVGPTGTVSSGLETSVGLPRQEHLAWVRGPGEHLAIFVSRTDGVSRILAQRVSDAGIAIDAAPALIHQGFEALDYAPAGAFNGSHYLITWLDATGLVLSRRVTPSLQVLGFGATSLMTSMTGAPSVAAVGNDFLVASRDIYSGDKSKVTGIRVDGSTGAPIEAAPFDISANYSFDPVVTTLGSNWLVTYTNRGCHDCNTDRITGRIYAPSGAPLGPAFVINGPGEGAGAAVAVAPDRVLVAYSDPTAFNNDRIEARIMLNDGTLVGNELVLADFPNRAIFASAAFDGTDFVVAWTDYRSVTGVEQLRGDIYAARVTTSGTVIDQGGGLQVSSGPQPEDYPAVGAASGLALIGYLALDGVGGSPEVQRVRYRQLGGTPICQPDLGFGGPGTATLSVCGELLTGGGQADLLVDSDKPSSVAFVALGASLNPTPLFGGTVVTVPIAGVLTLLTDASGDAMLPGIQSGSIPMTIFAQAAVFDPIQPGGFQLTNAIQVTLAP
ncbi:MAG: hypothetical protein P1V81_11525 [Planctomycetota bacterium]|nr:hypothetical protein [Planctomycetota bacterium]